MDQAYSVVASAKTGSELCAPSCVYQLKRSRRCGRAFYQLKRSVPFSSLVINSLEGLTNQADSAEAAESDDLSASGQSVALGLVVA